MKKARAPRKMPPLPQEVQEIPTHELVRVKQTKTLLKKGCFKILAALGSSMYKVVYLDKDGNKIAESDKQAGRAHTIKWIVEQRESVKDLTDVVIDDSFVAPVYYKIKLICKTSNGVQELE